MYLAKKVSEMSGVSVRTLHYYDEIGLLSPQKHENGYRYYSEEDMSVLQTVLFYKYLGFSLKQIKELLRKGENELLPHLRNQLLLMQKEKERLLTLIDTLKKTIESQERRMAMSAKEKFKGFTYEDNQKYKQEAMALYGKEVIEQAVERQKGKEQEITEGFNEIFFAFAENMSKGIKAAAEENVKLSKKLHEHLCRYSFDCPKDVFASIGRGYVQNADFKNNLDRFGEGTAQYVSDAISQYVSGKTE
ncbi:MAG: MerR family transcriptional regulator [Peptostreptococcaceae bacterium]|nr:MerR family transcriptional regulator [Peptostreptococcaceae bacterium]